MTVDLAPATIPSPFGATILPAHESMHIDLSLVIPIYNEVESIPKLYQTLSAVLEDQHCIYEIIFVDDGSNDGTFEHFGTCMRATRMSG